MNDSLHYWHPRDLSQLPIKRCAHCAGRGVVVSEYHAYDCGLMRRLSRPPVWCVICFGRGLVKRD